MAGFARAPVRPGSLKNWAPPGSRPEGFDFTRKTGGFGFARREPGFARTAPEETGGRAVTREQLETDWKAWVRHYFADYVSDADGDLIPFAPHHEEFWRHVWSIKMGVRLEAFLSVWPRGQAKSTSVEMACVALGATGRRLYVLYVCGTQDQADDHVANVGDMLGSERIAEDYPLLAEAKVGKYGSREGWRRNRLRTESGFTIDAVGLDTLSIRGKKLGKIRPDVIVFDDIDDEQDSEATVAKKIRTLSRKILPAGSDDRVVFGAQNLVHEDSVFSKIVDRSAGILRDATISGPVPAIEDFEYVEDGQTGDVRVVGGTATWPEKMPISRCEEIIKDEGLEAFLVERQHLTDAPTGNLVYRRSRVDAAIKRGDEVSYDGGALQVMALDPGYQKRAALLAVQETSSDRIQLWHEYSFTRCDDEYVASVAAEHMVTYRVAFFYYDAEDPGMAAAIKKAYLAKCAERDMEPVCRFQGVAFGTYKTYCVKVTRWMLASPSLAWGAPDTDVHVGDRYVGEDPGIFRSEVRKYKLDPKKRDVPSKERDHGPDAWAAYAYRWLMVWAKATNQKRVPPGYQDHEAA